ncbi:MAG: Asp-tRNA(Asn)/Glu-tRNA(Gln) amidotransferase subunit GatC [Patescibacteria group bacterium]
MSTITKEQVEHIAKLARLEFDDAQKEKMTKELGQILTYVEKLKEVNTEGVEPTAQVTGLEDVFRKDEAVPWWDGNPMDLVEAAPEHEGRFVKVKEVFKKV